MDPDFARDFAAEWLAAWNSHDLPRILAHYADDFEMTSPMIQKLAGEASGMLRGQAAVGAYWAKALALIPDLHFEPIATLVGVDSLALHYRGAGGRLVIEVLRFGPDLKVIQASAHYAD
ncbi:SnoaL-like domain-containing protein [Methylomagnum ishizawai]|uniref:SnoaL-like domain-containing protein n=1 Tax=Methylomagnum ishizawai TaxID=1760988 RepID=A0A1Y6CX74_9GAMM|nr:nuclear transport factor 2 family protein [Methylomagnum ishizawai]SMF94840.1 SnoaL-like domain-containing protein [Methylomagnum ishizawai]